MRRTAVLMCLGVLCLGAARAQASEAITNYSVGNASGAYVPGGAGFAFSPRTDMSVTALGFNGTGLTAEGYRVTLWANGEELASAVVTVGSSLLNQTFYQPISGVQLISGRTYYLSAAGTNSDYWIGNLIHAGLPSQSFSVGPHISYVGSASGLTGAGEFPLETGDASLYYVAPNFQYSLGLGTNLIWAATLTNQWDIGTTWNWFNPALNRLDLFYNGVRVLFDDTPNVLTNVNIDAGVTVVPTVVTNKSSTNNFVISGGGGIGGAAILVKDGTSTLTLGTSNIFTGDALVLGGTLRVGRSGALGATNGPTVVTNAATLDVNGMDLGAELIVVSGAGVTDAGAVVNNGPSQTNAVQHLKLAGDTTLGGSNRWDLGGGRPASLLTDGQPWKITKTGTNQVSLVAVSRIDPALGPIDIQQGIFSLQSTTAQLGNPSQLLTVRSNATLHFANLAATPLNRRIVLTNGALVWNDLGPSVVVGPVMLQGSNTVFVSTNGVPATLAFSNALTGAGSLSKIGSGTLVLAASNTYSGNTLVNTGTLALVGSATIGASAAIVLGPDTALDVSARSDSRLTLARGQLLSGAGTVLGSLTAGPGSTVSPGPAIALLSVTNDILLQGTNVMKLNKGAATNDVLLSGADLSYGGILRLTNLSGTLLPGDTFKLFSASNYTGMFTNVTPLPGSGLAWSTNLLTTNGTIAVVLASPVITNINWLRTNVIIAGTNGFPNTNYYVLSGTNLAVPLTNWTRLATNLFDLSGNFIFTNSSDPLLPEQYYLLQLP